MDITSLAKKSLLLVLMIAIAVIYLFFDFKGLTATDGMEKAQLAREISRGSFKTKSIRPISFGQFINQKKRTPFLHEVSRSDTYHAPLYPMVLGVVFKAVDAGNSKKWKMDEDDVVYQLDRVIVGLNMLFFMMAGGIAYLLARKLFDPTIATITFFILITTDLFWRFTQTGNASSLMLLLFMAAAYCIYLATETTVEESRNTFLFGTLAGGFLILLSFTHWMALWLLVGYLIYAFFFIRPVGGIATIVIVIAGLAFAYPVFNNFRQTGNPFGTAFYTLYTGLGTNEEIAFRSFSTGEIYFNIKDIILTFTSNLLSGFTRMFEYTGFIFAAPIFFLSCIHQFKSEVVSKFRWGVLIIWVFASIGMAAYGYGDDAYYSRQLHFLFGPVMAAFGIAMVAILWSRSPMELAWKSGYIWIIGAISSIPIFFSLPQAAINSLESAKPASTWPVTSAAALNRNMSRLVRPNKYVLSDQPWAVAWYADRHAIWTPIKYSSLQQLESIGQNQGLPIAGILFSPESLGTDSYYESRFYGQSLFSVSLENMVNITINGKLPEGTITSHTPESSDLKRKYPNFYGLVGYEMVYYSAESVDLSEPKDKKGK